MLGRARNCLNPRGGGGWEVGGFPADGFVLSFGILETLQWAREVFCPAEVRIRQTQNCSGSICTLWSQLEFSRVSGA